MEPMKCTPMMATMGWSVDSVLADALKLADVLAKDGPIVADAVRIAVKFAGAVAGRDVVGILLALQSGLADYQKIADDIKAAFA